MSKQRRPTESSPAQPSPPKRAKVAKPQATVAIGEAVQPGVTLRQVLGPTGGPVGRLAWSPDGRYLATPCETEVQIWDAATGVHVRTIDGEGDGVDSVAWTPDGEVLAWGTEQSDLVVVQTNGWRRLHRLESPREIKRGVYQVAFSPDGAALGFVTLFQSGVWNWRKKSLQTVLDDRGLTNRGIAWSPDGTAVATAVFHSARVFSASDGALSHEFKGAEVVHSVAWSTDGRLVAGASADRAIHLWEPASGRELHTLEGHSAAVKYVTFSPGGRWLASQGADSTVRIWRCDTWACVAVFDEPPVHREYTGVAFHPTRPILATLGPGGNMVRLWDLDESLLLGQASTDVQYTTAKLALVGDSGVGKTGLGWRLAHDQFKEHSSTHGQQFWMLSQLRVTRPDGAECEAVLWDLAGQHVYRPIHSMFLENVAAALLVFDPTNRPEPLKGVQYWLEQLRGRGQMPPAVLVGGRVDRGAPALSKLELEQFCQRTGIGGGYVSTSASTGEGLEVLLDRLRHQIPWDRLTATVTTRTFKRIKDFVLQLKESRARDSVLATPQSIREQLESSDRDLLFTDAELTTAIGHLETHGYVTLLRSSGGEQCVLLAPELLVTLASSVVLLADKSQRELGDVSEDALLQGAFSFDELAGLSQTDRQTLLDATIVRFLKHNICFRQTVAGETLLVFPGLIKQKRPLRSDLATFDDVSYIVRGRVENLYPSLVVLLGYTPSFTRLNQWQNQAQYETPDGEVCGFRVTQEHEGELDIVLYYGEQIPAEARGQFQDLFEQFLSQLDVDVTRFPPVVCRAGHRQERATIASRARDGKKFVYCAECGAKTDLPDVDVPYTIGISTSPWLQREEAAARLRSAYEVQLTKIKGHRRQWAVPRCYISAVSEQTAWKDRLSRDLREAGIYVANDPNETLPDDAVIVLDTVAYQDAFRRSSSELRSDLPLVRARLATSRLMSLTLTRKSSLHQADACVAGDFSDETHYPLGLFDVVLALYAIPMSHAGFAQVRRGLHRQWEETLAQFADGAATEKDRANSVFISYARNDEPFRAGLAKVLASLERRGVIRAWHDRRIEPGEEWLKAIGEAIGECQIAVLLISADFLASRFINEHELPALIARRQRDGLRIVPVIVRDCTWQSEPMLSSLQALPVDGKPVIEFAEHNGERDRIWKEIAQSLEKIARHES